MKKGFLLGIAAFALAPVTLCCACGLCAGAAESAPDDPVWLRNSLEELRARHNLPALAVAVVMDDRVVAVSAVGRRVAGARDLVKANDRFHLGSIAKPMTATLIGLLVDEHKLSWDLTLERMFPSLARTMQPAYRTVTIAQLLSHTSGMPYQPKTPESVTDARAATPMGRRYEYVRAALVDEPEASPGAKLIYGGGGIIAAHYAERITEQPYEKLIQERLFKPLGMKTVVFGCMASPGKMDGPWEHVIEGGKLKPIAPEPAQKAQARSPVGRNVCCSVADLGRFAALHLQGARNESRFLQAETFKKLQTAIPPTHATPGWFLGRPAWAKGEVLWHNGSNGRNYALCHIVPEERYAVCVMTNVGGDGVEKACSEVNLFVVKQIKAGKFARP